MLIPALVLRVPDSTLVAAGGFSDGWGLATALAMGADTVAMGTRFATTEELPLANQMDRAMERRSNGSTEQRSDGATERQSERG